MAGEAVAQEAYVLLYLTSAGSMARADRGGLSAGMQGQWG